MKQLVAVIHVNKPYKRRRLKTDPAHRLARIKYKKKMRSPDARRRLRVYEKKYERKNKVLLHKRDVFVHKAQDRLPPIVHSGMKQLQVILFPSLYAYHTLCQAILATGKVTASDGDGIKKQTLSEVWLTPNIVKRKQIWTMDIVGFGDPVNVEACYNKDGGYVGDTEHAEYLIEKGIVPECKPGIDVCSIGFCEQEQKWYGWSHRAMSGFKVGDNFYHSDTMFGGKGSFAVPKIIGSLEEARQAAINFSDDVS